MKKIIFLSVLIAATFTINLSAQVINDENAVARKLSGEFRSLVVENGIEVYISPSDEFSMAVSAATEEGRAAIKTEIAGGELKITLVNRGNLYSSRKKMGRQRVYISCPGLERIVGSGSSNIRLMSKLKAGSLRLELSGASDFKGSLEVDQLMVELSGASDAILGQGSAKTLKVNASGASNFEGFNLNANDCVVEASGASDVHVKADSSLKVHANGASTVLYRGRGELLEVKSSGASDVKRKEAPVKEI